MKTKVLITDDDKKHLNMLATLLEDWGYETDRANNGQEAVQKCARELPDIVLMDARMPVMDGFEALAKIRAAHPTLPVIMLTAYSDVQDAVNAIRGGAWDYLTKPPDFGQLAATLRNAAEKIKSDDSPPENKPGLLGTSPAIQELVKMISTIAPSEGTVLITGESGTGKELAARATHQASRRNKGPFVAINCGAMTESLLESELFGHEKGAFTGADRKHEGIFSRAAGGTIFLDEVGEMPLSMQVKLLRVLQEREVLSVGGTKPMPIDCRVIAATNRDLAEEVKAGRFREDLFYRLNVLTLHMPPLAERKEDIPALAEHFARRFAAVNHKQFTSITPAALRRLQAWSWPGNVRELENVMERAAILMPGEIIDERELPERLLTTAIGNYAPAGKTPDTSQEAPFGTLEEIERRVILKTLERFGNNKSETARALGITRKTLHAKLNRYKNPPGDES